MINNLFGILELYITSFLSISLQKGARPLLVLELMIGQVDRTIGAFGGIFLIFSILFSPGLRKFLSRRYFVFLGSISFPLYLIHGTFIRLPLQWAIVKLLPLLAPNALIYYEDGEVALGCGQVQCKFFATIIYVIWLACLLAASKFWKEYVDVWGIKFSRWGEEFALGKRDTEWQSYPWPFLNWRSLWSRAQNNVDPRMDISRMDTEKLL